MKSDKKRRAAKRNIKARWAKAALVVLLLLAPVPGAASVLYEFHGLTAAQHVQSFTLTTPAWLPVEPSPPEDAKFLQITHFDWCVSCSWLGVFFAIFTPTNGGNQSALIQFDDVDNIGYSYSFVPGAFFGPGTYTTEQWDTATFRVPGPFDGSGTLVVTQLVPGPSTWVLLALGLSGAMFLHRRRRLWLPVRSS